MAKKYRCRDNSSILQASLLLRKAEYKYDSEPYAKHKIVKEKLKILPSDLYFYYPNIGSGYIEDRGSDNIGISLVINEDSLKGKSFEYVCNKLKEVWGDIPNKPNCIKQIEYFMSLGKQGIYSIGTEERKMSVQRYRNGRYVVLEGNKRVIALYLLGETEIEFS